MKRLLLMAGVLTTATVAAQPLDGAWGKQAAPAPVASPTPAFEVASIKRNTSGEGFIAFNVQPGRLNLINVPVRQLIQRAYQVQPYQVQGRPSWITSDRFDVIAKAPDATLQTNDMLQTLLADRFKLRVHKETRQEDVYRLVKARSDGKLGEAMKPAALDCSAVGRGQAGPGPRAGGAAPAPAPGTAPVGPTVARAGGPPGPGGPVPACRMMIAPGRLEVLGQTMASLAATLANQLGRPVVDETGLAGPYDFTLTFMPDAGGRGLPPGAGLPGAPDLPPIDPNAPSLPTALQEQLGLKLEAAKGPVEMIVIDSIEPPTED